MCYVCDVLYAVLYVRLKCFVVRGCAVLRRYLHVCNSDVVSVVNMISPFEVVCCCCSPFSLVHLSLVFLPRDS